MQYVFGEGDWRTVYIESPMYTDLNIVQCGQQKFNSSGHPRVWRHVLVHYVYKGHGVYTMNGRDFDVKAGEAFVIFPNDVVTYVTQEDDPWEYRWVEIGGAAEQLLKKAKITRKNPIIEDTPAGDVGQALQRLVQSAIDGSPVYLCMAGMWEFIHAIILAADGYEGDETQQERYVRSAQNLVRNSYQKKITVEKIAQEVGLERTYLNKLFQRYEGMSVQQYMMQCRMKNALELLKNPRLSIGDVGINIGYDDQFTFSKAFKKYHKVSPTEWRKEEFSKQIYKKEG